MSQSKQVEIHRMTLSDVVRFWGKVEKSSHCWEWVGSKSPKGYGQFWLNGKTPRAHRISYSLAFGFIPDGLDLDHRCLNPKCVNPSHLEPVTTKENVLRGTGFTAVHARKTHCHRGHEFTEANTGQVRGGRRCKTCHRGDALRYYHHGQQGEED